MNNFQIFININLVINKLFFIIINENDAKTIFYKKIDLYNNIETDFFFLKKIETILKETILEIEKKLNTSINRVNLMIEDKKINSIDITINKNIENKKINKNTIEYLLQDLRLQIVKNHPEKRIIHIIIKKCFIDGEEYSNIPFEKSCKNLLIETSFIYFKKSLLSKIELLLNSHQIFINKTICTNYAKSLLNSDIEDLSKAGMVAIKDANLNEVGIYPKKSAKMGFFEKLFHTFS